MTQTSMLNLPNQGFITGVMQSLMSRRRHDGESETIQYP